MGMQYRNMKTNEDKLQRVGTCSTERLPKDKYQGCHQHSVTAQNAGERQRQKRIMAIVVLYLVISYSYIWVNCNDLTATSL